MDSEPIHLLAYWDKQLMPQPLPALDGPGSRCEVTLRKLPGTRQVRVVLKAGDASVFRAELDADEGMPQVTLDIRRGDGNGFEVECREGAPVRRLQDKPNHAEYETPIDWPGPPQSIDVAIVVDATARIFLRDEAEPHPLIPSPLLARPNRQHWEAHVDTLCGFVAALRRSCANCRIAVLAFGDQPMPDNVTADDLLPAYLIHPAKPEQRSLQALDAEALRGRLLAIPPSSGGDFVDALADALAACDKLLWSQRPGARRLVFVSGESPGHSILHPLRKGDACVREHDVDTQALRLHRKGVALLSLYHGQPADYLESLAGNEKKELQEATREQYARLATLPSFVFDTARFEGGTEAEAVLGQSGLLGYGGCCGEWVD